jgi:hypothetical protein
MFLLHLLGKEVKERMKKILQVNFKLRGSKYQAGMGGPDAEARANQMLIEDAKSTLNIKGLLWKIFLHNEAERSAGGIYLFEDDASVQAFLNAVMATQKNNPDFEVKVFDVVPEPTKIARGPMD